MTFSMLLTAGQAQWVPGEEGGIVFVGWENTPRRLGFVYCLNRRCVPDTSYGVDLGMTAFLH